MKKFNINDRIYVQITEYGWEYLRYTVGDEYIKNCIDNSNYRHIINGEIWHQLQMHEVFDLLPIVDSHKLLIETTILFDVSELEDYEKK